MKKIWIVLAIAIVCLFSTAFLFANRAIAAPVPVQRANASANAWTGCVYVVRPGENLFRIAARYGISYWYLAQINGLHNPNYIYAGQMLSVPCGNGFPPPSIPPGQCAPSTTYLVQPKDNLFRIALNHGTTINAIRDANHLWGRVLRPGTTLIIPCPGSVQYANQTPLPPAPPPTGVVPPTAVPPPTGIVPPTALPPPTGQLPQADATVTLQDGKFDPAQVDVRAGQTVLWVNNSQNTYTLLSGIPGQPNSVFASPPLGPGGTFVFKFDTAGNYSYYVSENPIMVGQVNVAP